MAILIAVMLVAGTFVSPATGASSRGAPDGQFGWMFAFSARWDTGTALYVQRQDENGLRRWGTHGAPVCTLASRQENPSICGDGQGGAFVAWESYPTGGSLYAIRVQHVDAAGIATWATDGIVLGTYEGRASGPHVVSDSSGGAIVLWQEVSVDSGEGSVRGQRIDAAGTSLWGDGGVIICSRAAQLSLAVIPDGAGGALAAWMAPGGAYAQRIDANGQLLWQAEGVPLGVAPFSLRIASDGDGGVIAAWTVSSNTIHAQRILANGDPAWTPRGVTVSTGEGLRLNPALAPDGLGGAIIAWEDSRGGFYYSECDLFMQHLDARGSAMWSAGGIVLCDAAGTQYFPTLVSDGAGGAIAAWEDSRIPGLPARPHNDLYVQRVTGAGARLWEAQGNRMCAGSSYRSMSVMVADGADGAIVGWWDHRTAEGDLYAQRIDAQGAMMWASDGVIAQVIGGYQRQPSIVADADGGSIVVWSEKAQGKFRVFARRFSPTGVARWPATGVCSEPSSQFMYQSIPDGGGGVIVAWGDSREDRPGLYAQRFDSTGASRWAGEGVALCTAAGFQSFVRLVSDGEGGAIATWADERSGDNSAQDIYVQRVDRSGTPRWTTDGERIATSHYPAWPAITGDGVGGAIVAWEDARNAIYAQAIDARGIPRWRFGGIPVCTAAGYQMYPALAPDGARGAIIAWNDTRSGSVAVYAQRLTDLGAPAWATDGQRVSPGGCQLAGMATSISSGAVLVWLEFAFGPGAPPQSRLMAQGLDASGAALWGPNGIPVSDENRAATAAIVTSDGAGGVFVGWGSTDTLSWITSDITAQQVRFNGQLGWAPEGVPVCTAPSWQGSIALARDARGGVAIAWQDHRNHLDDYVYLTRLDSTGVIPTGWPANGAKSLAVSFAGASVRGDRVLLTWLTSEAADLAADIYRSIPGGPWELRGSTSSELTGRFQFEDRVPSAGPYLYRLAIPDVDEEYTAAEIRIEVLYDFKLAIDGARPNPTRGRALMIHFTLSNAAPATLELLDVAGRRIVRSDVGSLGAGRHALDLHRGGRLAPGLYLARLRQGGVVRVARVVVLE